MILVVVPMHAVTSDWKKIREPIEIGAQPVEFPVKTEIRGVGLRHPHDGPVEHIASFDHADRLELASGKINELLVLQRP